METKIIKIGGIEDTAEIKAAADILKNGGIVAIPTETVYGLASSALSDTAIAKVFTAKGRPQDNPLIVHICDMEMLDTVAVDIPKSAYLLAEKFWPGPLTMVLKKSNNISESVSRGLNTVAVRMPSDKIAREIIAVSGLPLAAPSANTSGKPSPTTAQHVIDDLNGKIDAIIDSHDCTVGVESTVISLVGEVPRLLRPGAVTAEQLREIIGDIEIDNAVLNELKTGEKAASPGMKYKHYAPAATVYLVEAESGQFAEFVNAKTDAVAVCFDEDAGITVPCISYGSCKNEITLAQNLFKVLRDIDKRGIKNAYIHAPSKSGVGLAVYNRLIRAAAFRVIKL